MSKKIMLPNGKEVQTATPEQLAKLDAKSNNFDSDITVLQSGDVVKFNGDIVPMVYSGVDFGVLVCDVSRDGATFKGLVSQSSLQAMALTKPNPEIGTEKFMQINPQFANFRKISELAANVKDKQFSVAKTENLFRVADWIDSTEKKADGKFKKTAKTFMNPITGTTNILTKAKDFNIFTIV